MLPENINVFDQWKKTFHIIPIFYKIKRKLHYILQNEFEHPSKKQYSIKGEKIMIGHFISVNGVLPNL